MAAELTGRLAALGRAHDLVRPLPGQQGRAALLGDLLSILLAPYEDLGAFNGRIRVAVPRMGTGEGAATALALTFHELATNSLKYGPCQKTQESLVFPVLPREKTWCSRGLNAAGPRFSRRPLRKVMEANWYAAAFPGSWGGRLSTTGRGRASLSS